MSTNPSKRRRLNATQSINFENMKRIFNIIIKLNLKQWNHILLNWIKCNYNKNIDEVQIIFDKYLCDNVAFNDSLCGKDYMNINMDLLNHANINYNQDLDVLKIFHKEFNHIVATYSKDPETNKKQLIIQSSVYVTFTPLQGTRFDQRSAK